MTTMGGFLGTKMKAVVILLTALRLCSGFTDRDLKVEHHSIGGRITNGNEAI